MSNITADSHARFLSIPVHLFGRCKGCGSRLAAGQSAGRADDAHFAEAIR